MKETLIALCAFLTVCTARVVINADTGKTGLLGDEECTWGPSYWCENLKTAAGCHATNHCIKSTWEKMEVPEDTDSVCGICKDMVQQARDQLESNQTQADLKAVFEGSCMLIHIKPIVKECITLVDQFIPELVETLASQMNPSVVCSVAGLCNSARIDKLLEEYEQSKSKVDMIKSHSLENDQLEPDNCSKCYAVAAHMEYKLNHTPRDKMLRDMLNVCAELGTFTDACSATILTYFDTIYDHLQGNFNAENICHLSGQCSAKFHKHEGDTVEVPKVEIKPLSSVGMVDVTDDLPCKLCEQLVDHLRDLLVANTTEVEFQEVLDGLCKQTKSFAAECTAIVDEYYPQIYSYLTNGLNTHIVCQMSGICPAPQIVQNQPIWPLLPSHQAEIGVRILKNTANKMKTELSEEWDKSEAESMQLPIERMTPLIAMQSENSVSGAKTCALCEYLLHYIQQAITNPTTEEEVKEVIGKVCNKLPESIRGECTEFIDTYGDAVVAILAQQIDPSQVCPMLHMCPTEELMELWRNVPEDYMLVEEVESKPSCPLCLLAVTQIYNVIKDNKTEASIEAELDKLCVHLPHSLADQCKDLVQGYSHELIGLLLADLTPQEVCVYIKLCDATKNPGPKNLFITDTDGEILTNEIPNVSLHLQQPVDKEVTCVICEFAMQYVDKAIVNKKTKDEIEHIVHGVCNHLPKTISQECNRFVDQYADVVIEILSQDVSPHEVCSMIGLCHVSIKQVEESLAECALCEVAISTIDKLLTNPKLDEHIEEIVSKVCKYLPASKQDKCVKMIEVYGQSIINLINAKEDAKNICKKIALCSPNDHVGLLLRGSPMSRLYKRNIQYCTWGEAYWCSSNETAEKCKAVKHCKENVWKNEVPPQKQSTSSEQETSV